MSTNSGQKIQRDQKTQLPLLKSLEQKQGTENAPTLNTTRVGRTLGCPSGPNPAHPYPQAI